MALDYDHKIEANVIANCLLFDEDIMDAKIGIHSPDVFHDPVNREVWKSILLLYAAGVPIDRTTVLNDLQGRGVAKSIVEFPKYSPTRKKNTKALGLILGEKYLRRRLANLSSITAALASDEAKDIFDSLDLVTNELDNISKQISASGGAVQIAEGIDQVIAEAEERRQLAIDGQETTAGRAIFGIKELDTHLAGLRPGNIIIGGRPGSGKSALCFNNLAYYSARNGIPNQIESLEMPRNEVQERLLCSLMDIDYGKFQDGNLSDMDIENLKSAKQILSAQPLWIDDKSGRMLTGIHAQWRGKIGDTGLKMGIMDNIQYIKLRTTDRRVEIGDISRRQKEFSKDFEFIWVTISHLSRGDKTGNKRPRLEELKESGDLEQNADCVLLVYRPIYYGMSYVQSYHKKLIDDLYSFGYGPQIEEIIMQLAYIDIAKNRGRQMGSIPVKWIGKHQKFESWENQHLYDILRGQSPSTSKTQASLNSTMDW